MFWVCLEICASVIVFCKWVGGTIGESALGAWVLGPWTWGWWIGTSVRIVISCWWLHVVSLHVLLYHTSEKVTELTVLCLEPSVFVDQSCSNGLCHIYCVCISGHALYVSGSTALESCLYSQEDETIHGVLFHAQVCTVTVTEDLAVTHYSGKLLAPSAVLQQELFELFCGGDGLSGGQIQHDVCNSSCE